MTYRVAGIGEVLWDCFSHGERLGGAPANFAFHASQLGAGAHLVSRIGLDSEGYRLVEQLTQHGQSLEFLQRDPVYPTGHVRVELKEGQPSYVIQSPAAWDYLELTDGLKNLAPTLDAVCFGTLAQRHPISRRAIQEFLQLCPEKTLRLFDINLRQDFFSREILEFGLSHATVLKLSGEELERLAGLFDWSWRGDEALEEIFRCYPVKCIALTHGAEGSEIRTRKESVRSKAPKVDCVDAVGAGDAFSAALVTGLLANHSLQSIADSANRIGAYVASQPGAMPLLPQEYKTL